MTDAKHTKKMSRDQKVMLFVLGTLESLKSKGFVAGGGDPLTETGVEAYWELKSEGFEPTNDEIKAAMEAILRPGRRAA